MENIIEEDIFMRMLVQEGGHKTDVGAKQML